ncbi:isovaleryl-CoA dehydrogenase [Trichodelitschia bisporula]|uniref:Isovaleryl-CoA dehydrogenase n=1 Tax=Trichodelitschia bisporula TaxID=703511 RepID=A0A6G1HPY5_9PEZI|nr:isovaleryl-CoA dehydrogenase [Trichodelitschia bisporula]
MATSTLVPRLLARSIRQTCRQTYLPRTATRAASSIHPKGFTPPTNDELFELREQVSDFTRREIPPSVAHATDLNNDFPTPMWGKLGSAGFLGVTADEEYGGLGMGYQAHCVVMEELSRASGSIGLSYAAHSQLCVNQLMLHGTPEQKAAFLPELISGELVGALAMTEAQAGSDVLSMRTKATKVKGGWELSGAKLWITNGPDAHLVIVYAKTDPGARKITAFIVDTSAPGFSVTRKLDKLGMRGSNTGELAFDSVFVPDDRVLGEINGGTKVLMKGLDLERLVLSAGPLGLMRGAFDVALPYVHSRTQFGDPIGHFQLVQGKLADMYTAYQRSAALTYALAAAVDTGSAAHFARPESLFPPPADVTPAHDARVRSQDCAAAILGAAESATRVAMDAVQLLGGMGYSSEMAVGRIMRDAKLYEIGAGTSEVRRVIIGRALNRLYVDV